MADADPITQPQDDAPVERRRASGYFDRAASYWRDVYAEKSLQGLIYRERFGKVLDWSDRLLRTPGRVLEIGPGAGRLTVELARRGHHVDSIDSSEGMLELTAEHCAREGLADRVHVSVGDVHRLAFPDQIFDLVIAVGVVPWLDRPQDGVAEMARVLAPGGHLVMTADNRSRMNILIEPRLHPLLVPIKLGRRALRHRLGTDPQTAISRLHSRAHTDRLLHRAGLRKLAGSTQGFGPFTVLGRTVLRPGRGLRVHARLQSLADRGIPVVRAMGWHYIVVARRPG